MPAIRLIAILGDGNAVSTKITTQHDKLGGKLLWTDHAMFTYPKLALTQTPM